MNRAVRVSCPLCRGPLNANSLRYFPPEPQTNAAAQEEQERYDVKIDSIVREVVSSSPEDKFLIFSNFKSSIARVNSALNEVGVVTRVYSTNKSIPQRQKIMDEFADEGSAAKVLFLPLRSTAVGLNITCANRIIFIEPCMSPALENQAIGRCWRMGQTRDVRVQRFVLKNTIESRIVEGNSIMDGTIRDSSGTERLLQGDRDRVRWGFSRLQWLLS